MQEHRCFSKKMRHTKTKAKGKIRLVQITEGNILLRGQNILPTRNTQKAECFGLSGIFLFVVVKPLCNYSRSSRFVIQNKINMSN
jgi:hypothetical protein